MSRLKATLTNRLMRYGKRIPDSLYIRLLFFLKMGYWPNLRNPKTFNEKLQWLKLYNRQQNYTMMVDKLAAKEYVGKVIGDDHIIPTIGVWKRPEDIEWNQLPTQFVLKTTHGGGNCGVVICKDKTCFNRSDAIAKLNRSLNQDIYNDYREWPYKNVPRRIIAEPFLTDNGRMLEDYKIHNFNGVPRFILLCRDRFLTTGMTDDFYSVEWEHLDVKRPGHDNHGGHECPKELPEMLELAKELSMGIPFIRTDFYIINHKVYFGELTFFPASGLSHFEPEKWDVIFGKMLNLQGK